MFIFGRGHGDGLVLVTNVLFLLGRGISAVVK